MIAGTIKTPANNTIEKYRNSNARFTLIGRALIDGPRSRCGKFDRVTGRVAEVDTLAAEVPPYSALDCDAAFLEPSYPRFQRLGGDGKCQMHGPLSIVRRNPATRHVQTRHRTAAPKEEQNSRLTRVHRDKALTRSEYVKVKNISVKGDGFIQIIKVQRCFQHPRDDRRSYLVLLLLLHSSCDEHLADMSLGVFGCVKKQSHHCRWKLLAADSARLVQRLWLHRTQKIQGTLHLRIERID